MNANNIVSKNVKELTKILNKIKNSRRIRRIVYKARKDKTQIAAFAVWFSLSVLCFTVFICADHAVDALKTKRSDSVKTAIFVGTEAIDSGGDESVRPDAESENCRQRPHGKEWHNMRPKPSERKNALAVSDAKISFNTVSSLCMKCRSETNQFKEDHESKTESGETAGPINPDVSSKSYNWYCKNNDSHIRPTLPPEFSFLKKNNGYWQGTDGCGKVIYLTFDAGYENGNVLKILDILSAKKVNGAFFILDNFVRRNPELVKRMAEEGHLICNHTSHHKDMTALSAEEFTSELTSLENTVREFTGLEIAKYYRPPCGALSERDLNLASTLGYKTVMWSYAYADWDNKSQMIPSKALEKLMLHTHEGMVLLLHPTSSTNTEILDDFIDNMTAQGWRFGRIDELTAS